MGYKLMAVDVDGTLLDSKGVLTQKTQEAIKQGVESGLVFVISSGRPIQGVEQLNRKLNLDLPFITYNGAMVVMGKSKEILYEQKLSQKDAKSIIELGEKYKTTVIVWRDNKLFVNEINENSKRYGELTETEPILINDMEEITENGVTKILWFDEVDSIEKYQAEVGELLSTEINYHTSQPWFLEFVHKKASKAIAMEKIGEYYGIEQCEMIAVGDGFNDLSMIEYAGLGVAMGNSREEIKKKANYVTLSNDEDGVAHVIYKFVLNH